MPSQPNAQRFPHSPQVSFTSSLFQRHFFTLPLVHCVSNHIRAIYAGNPMNLQAMRVFFLCGERRRYTMRYAGEARP